MALKCLKGELQENDSLVQMLLDEAKITVRMTHKNIGQVYGLEHDGNTYFMVMDLVDGINLADLCHYLFDMNRVFPVEAAVFIAKEVCEGLSYAHRMTDDNGEPLGIVHRDVNPQNICISRGGEVKLIDFGIAKARIAPEDSQVGTIKGKFNYMSPEQARGERVDQRTDIFALGAVLYEMLCGHMIYPLSLDDARLRTKSKMADFVPIENYLPDLPDKLRKIVNKCLTRDINQRFANSRELFLALSQFSHDSCKLYDALNLSILVEKCIAFKKTQAESGSKTSHNALHGVPRSGSNFSMESGETAIINTEKALQIASEGTDSEEAKTIVYQDKEIHPSNASLDVSSICRSVDLSIDMKAASAKTLMCNINDVDNVSNSSAKRLSKSLYNSIMTMHERTLILIAATLTALLVLAIILFATTSSDHDKDNAPQTVEKTGDLED